MKLRLTADKRESEDFPKFASQTSFILDTLGGSQTVNIVKRIKL